MLREVAEESTAIGIWGRLEALYMRKSLLNQLYLKKRLYTLHMDEGKLLKKQMDDFNKIDLDLKSIDDKIDDEDQAIILLSSLPKRYEHFVDTMLHGKESLTMAEVKAALNSKEPQKNGEAKEESQPKA